jgi:transposase
VDNIKKRTQRIKGVDYVYEDTSYWDKAKKQNRHKREYIGKLGVGGEFIPNKKYQSRHSKVEEAVSVSLIPASRSYYGAVYLLDRISDKVGIRADLKASFPKNYKALMSLCYYLVLEGDSPMYRFSRWSHDHRHPYEDILSSQRISEIERDIEEGGRIEFLRRQSKRRQEHEYLAYDTTSVSSWSQHIKAVRYGHNKDGDNLAQVNMALLFGEVSSLPVYYRVLPGNIVDVSIIKKLIKDVEFLEIDKLKLVMDRGFFSADNINALYKGHYKFLISAKTNSSFISETVKAAKEAIKDFKHYDIEHGLYYFSYVEQDKAGNVVSEGKRRIYVHIYYNGLRAEEEKGRFSKRLAVTEAVLRSGETLSKAQAELCEKYFTVKSTPKRGIVIEYNEEAIARQMNKIGYFVLISNEIKDPITALVIYRKKDLVEKAFYNLKERLEMKRTSVHSDETLAGKFFIQFLALIYVSYIHKHMREHKLFRNYTLQSLLDALDIIELYEYEGHRPHLSEITQKQKYLFECLDVPAPNTL